jgi:hypothetical protein
MTDPFPIPAGAATQDVLTVLRPDMANDTAHYQRYEIDIQLKSDYNPQTCVSTRANANEFYTITVTPVLSGGSSYTASGFCLESYDDRNPMGTCLRDPPTFVPESSTDKAASLDVDGAAQPLACFKTRPGLDAVLVLDKSGSMTTPTVSSLCPAAASCTRMDALRNAVNAFATLWAGLEPRVTPRLQIELEWFFSIRTPASGRPSTHQQCRLARRPGCSRTAYPLGCQRVFDIWDNQFEQHDGGWRFDQYRRRIAQGIFSVESGFQ